MEFCMSRYISLGILASLGLGRSKTTSNRDVPDASRVRVADCACDVAATRDEPQSASRIRAARVRTQG
jgi:hypothetical protein